MRMRSFVIGVVALVFGGSLLGYLPLDSIWGFVLLVSVGIFWLVDKEKELPQSPELSESLNTRDTTRVIAFFIFLIVIARPRASLTVTVVFAAVMTVSDGVSTISTTP